MAKLVFWCRPFHCCSLFLHSYTDFSTDSNKTSHFFGDIFFICFQLLCDLFNSSRLFIFVKIVWQWNIIQYFVTFPKRNKCFNLFPSPILLRGNSFSSLPQYFFCWTFFNRCRVGGYEDDESLFDNESSETIEEDAEKLMLYEFTATVLFFWYYFFRW